jgi:photosystem II stability/assembly factor-like uncharacterized protein
MGGRSKWSPAATPQIAGASFTSSACWTSGCLIGGTANGGTVVLLVNPAEKVSSDGVARPPGLGISGLACTGSGRCLALVSTATTTAVFETTDSASSWHQLSTLPERLASAAGLSCANAVQCVAVGSGPSGAAVVTTRDGGRRWALAARPGGYQAFTSVGCGPALECLATVRVTAGATQLLESRNAGQSWTALAVSVPSPGAVECATDATCLVGGGTTGGAISTFVRLLHERPLTLAYVPDPVVAVACATPTRCVAITPASTVSVVA